MDYSMRSRYFDLYAAADFDLRFWETVAANTPGPRLELMCGTGRVASHLLQAGYPVEGVDRCAGMLACCRSKTGGRLLLHHADITRMALPQRYGLVYIALHSFGELTGAAERDEALGRISRLLLPEGRFWLTVQNALFWRSFFDGSRYDLGVFPLPQGGTVSVSGSYSSRSDGLVEGKQEFREQSPDGRVQVHCDPVAFLLPGAGEIRAELCRAGLQVLGEYGEYDFTPYQPESSRWLILECAAG